MGGERGEAHVRTSLVHARGERGSAGQRLRRRRRQPHGSDASPDRRRRLSGPLPLSSWPTPRLRRRRRPLRVASRPSPRCGCWTPVRGAGQGGPAFGAGETRNVTLAGASIPAGAVSVALNVTVTQPSTTSFLDGLAAGHAGTGHVEPQRRGRRDGGQPGHRRPRQRPGVDPQRVRHRPRDRRRHGLVLGRLRGRRARSPHGHAQQPRRSRVRAGRVAQPRRWPASGASRQEPRPWP